MVPEALKTLSQWLGWKLEQKSGQKKPAKMPYYVDGGRRVGTQGDERDRQRLTTFEHAMEQMSRARYDGVGFAFLKGDGLIGIDLDSVINPETGEISERALAIVTACNSFTEYSPSATGLHIYVQGETTTFKSNDIGLEVFCGAQYFTVTGKHFPGSPETVNPISAAVLSRLRATVDQAKGKRQAAPPKQSAGTANDFARVNEAALASLDAWVPTLFPSAKRAQNGYRVPQRDLGRDLQEDLSIHQDGIVDWGVADMGDPKQGKRTPIDLVLEWGNCSKPNDALHWLASRLNVEVQRRAPRGSGAKKSSGGSASQEPPPEDPPPPDDQGEERRHGKLVIKWREGQLHEIVDLAERALLEATERIYQRDKLLVRVTRRAAPSVRNYKRPAGSLGLQTVDPPYLTELLTRSAYWERWNAKADDWRPINAPEKVAITYLARSGHWKLPELWGVITAPTLRPDGTILQKPGYDPDLKVWYDPCGIEFPEVPERPTKSEATAALNDLDEAFDQMPFRENVDRAVALSLALTALVRRSLPAAPLGAITAPIPAAGKTLIADCIAILGTGSPAPAMSYSDNDDEAKKTALAVLMEGDVVVLIDNIERPLQGDWLCSILTSEQFSQRVLGRTEMAKVLTTTLFLATGNQLVITGDLRTRALLCRLDPQCERPEEREFMVDLREQFLRLRPRLVTAGLTVMRAFLASRESVPVKPWGRFESWSDMVRAPLVWLGYADPCESLRTIETDDPERGLHLRFMLAWLQEFEGKPKTSREAITWVEEAALRGIDPTPLMDVIRDIATDRGEKLNVKRLSGWIGRHVSRIVAGMHLLKDGQHNHTDLWKVEKVMQNTS